MQRTSGSRASFSPAARRSWAIFTSSALKRSLRSIVRKPTAPSLSMRMCDAIDSSAAGDEPPPYGACASADARQRLALDLRDEALAEAGVEDEVPGPLGDGRPHDGGAAAQGVLPDGRQHLLRRGGAHADD